MTARKLKPEEVKAWEEQAPTERATYLFIRGMLEITAKAYAERGAPYEPLPGVRFSN